MDRFQEFYPSYNALKTTYGFIRDIEVTPPEPPKSLDDLLGKVQETIKPAYVVWPLIGIWNNKGNARMALEQKKIETVEKLWEHSELNKNNKRRYVRDLRARRRLLL